MPTRISSIFFLRWQIFHERKKNRDKHEIMKSREKEKNMARRVRDPERSAGAYTPAEVRKTTTSLSPLFFFHPVWITIIPPSIVYCGGELFYYRSVGRTQMLTEGVGEKEARTEERCKRETEYAKNNCAPAIPWFIDLAKKNHRSVSKNQHNLIIYRKKSISLVDFLIIHIE